MESKTHVTHQKVHDKHHTEDDAKSYSRKLKTSRHSKQQHYMDKRVTSRTSVNSHSKSPGWSKQTECVEVLEKTNTKASMEHEKYELIENQPGSDEEISPEEEEEGDISECSTGVKCVERISYTKVVHCVM